MVDNLRLLLFVVVVVLESGLKNTEKRFFFWYFLVFFFFFFKVVDKNAPKNTDVAWQLPQTAHFAINHRRRESFDQERASK